jgi:hypothetical protein
MPRWYPALPRTPFRDRIVKLWAALAIATAGLAVGLGVGFAIGHATGDDDGGQGHFKRLPGGPGPGLGDRFGWDDGWQHPDASDAPDARGRHAPESALPPTG